MPKTDIFVHELIDTYLKCSADTFGQRLASVISWTHFIAAIVTSPILQPKL